MPGNVPPHSERDESLASEARALLARNDLGGWTRPAPGLYPHLWSWDSAFIALGLRHHAPEAAWAELETCMGGQWANGMVPHIRFSPDPDGAYFPGPEVWQVGGLAHGPPAGVETSGILQPPVHAMAALALFQQGCWVDDDLFGRLFEWHHYLMGPRDPERSGTITIVHPWESGTDNSPRWDAALFEYALDELPSFTRVDQGHVGAAAERPRDRDYVRYIDLLQRLRRVGYQVQDLPEDYPFRIKDVLMTAVFAAANRDLMVLAERLGKRRELDVLRGFQLRVLDGFERRHRWNHARGAWPWFVDYDLVADRQVKLITCAGAAAPLVDLPSLEDPDAWLKAFLDGPLKVPGSPVPDALPSLAYDHELLEPTCYWRGPGWVNIQWLVARGLGEGSPLAARMRRAGMELVRGAGFREYFDLRDGAGLGAEDFSWSATLVLDWMAG